MNLFEMMKKAYRSRCPSRSSPVEVFSHYARVNKWGDKDSLSGKGSNLEATAELRKILPALLHELGAKSLLDVPCGDFFWMAHVDLGEIAYTGGDIVPELIATNQRKYARSGRKFAAIDLISGKIPAADVIFVRDCLVHLSNDHVEQALRNIAASGGKWLLTTIFPESCQRRSKNRPRGGAKSGQWRGATRHGARADQIACACHGALACRANFVTDDQVSVSSLRARLWPSR